MNVTLYEHQKLAVEELRVGSILCGRVGSGKSRTALAYWFEKIGKNVPLYIITPPKKRDSGDWEREASLFDAQKLVVDSWNNVYKYTKVCNAFFIFDEQRVVGKGVWVKSFLTITKNNRWILLSATPGDTWSDYIPVFVANGFYKNRTDFIRQHVVFSRIARYPKIERYIGERRLQEYKRRIVVLMRYAHPTKVYTHIVKTEYPSDMYQDLIAKRWHIYEDRPIRDMSELCRVLRYVVRTHPSCIDCLLEILKKRKKAVIFYNYNYELDMLRTLGQYITVSEWNGHKHEPIPDADSWVYLVQYNAGSDAWECIKTNTLIFFSLNYSYKTMAQAAGRIDRMNTPFDELHYYYFDSGAPIEKAIVKALKEKRDFNDKTYSI